MAKLYFNTRDELSCIETDMIAVVKADGNYSQVVYIMGKELTLTMGISKLDTILKSYNGKKNRFVRLGRSIIINHSYLSKVDILKQILVLSDNGKNEIRVSIPKNILKSYKNAIAKSIKIKEKKGNEDDNIG